MNLLGHRFGVACTAILSVLALAQSFGTEPLVAPPANGLVRVSPNLRAARVAPPESLALQGISTLGNEPVVLLSEKTRLGYLGYWLAAGDSFFGYTVKAIAKDNVILVRRDTAAEIKIPLASASLAPGNPKPYSKVWINSRANPMLNYAQITPGRMYSGNWDKLTGKKKTQVLEFYRKHGWQLIPARPGLGPTQFEWRNLYEAERAAAIETNRGNFERTLTPEQLGLWKQMRGFQHIYPEPGGFTDAQREVIAARQRIIDEFKKSLTPEQKAEHESIQDFTKANWK
jgi:hypothetical protein